MSSRALLIASASTMRSPYAPPAWRPAGAGVGRLYAWWLPVEASMPAGTADGGLYAVVLPREAFVPAGTDGGVLYAVLPLLSPDALAVAGNGGGRLYAPLTLVGLTTTASGKNCSVGLQIPFVSATAKPGRGHGPRQCGQVLSLGQYRPHKSIQALWRGMLHVGQSTIQRPERGCKHTMHIWPESLLLLSLEERPQFRSSSPSSSSPLSLPLLNESLFLPRFHWKPNSLPQVYSPLFDEPTWLPSKNPPLLPTADQNQDE